MKAQHWQSVRPRLEELESRVVPTTLFNSTNWSGYAVATSAGTVTAASGNWVVPTAKSGTTGYSAAWVGIDGANSSTVEQIGTESDFVGRANYYAWYEMFPAGFVTITSLTIKPGDTMSASVTFIGSNQFTLSITDVTSGKSFTTTQTSTSAV